MDLREKILRTSLDLMMRIGPQSVTMDMVARDCGISKRTLYETFPNKHNLISNVIKYNQQKTHDTYTEIYEQSSNSFEALMGFYTHARELVRRVSPVFVADIKRLYPEVFDEYQANEVTHIDALAKILSRSQDEGLALPGIKCKIAAFLLINTIKNLHNMPNFPFPEFTITEVFDGAFLNFMRGIATEKGQVIIDDYILKHLTIKDI